MSEYNQRAMLCKLGYNSDIDRLSTFKADCFTIVADEINKRQEAQMKKAGKQGRGRHR